MRLESSLVTTCIAVILLWLSTGTRLVAEDIWQKAANESLAPIQDTPGLPRVLLIGDSISMYYTVPVRTTL